jgi:hypothetical protein
MADVQSSDVDAINFDHSTTDHEILYADWSWKDEQFFNEAICGENKHTTNMTGGRNYKHGRRLKVIIHILFYGDNPCAVSVG